MQSLRMYKLILCIAALLFIAKPFLGFSLYNQLQDSGQENSVIVKAFAKRKPEFMEESIGKSMVFQALLKDKADQFVLTINALLSTFISALSFLRLNGYRSCHSQQKQGLNAIDPIYLLNCKLTI